MLRDYRRGAVTSTGDRTTVISRVWRGGAFGNSDMFSLTTDLIEPRLSFTLKYTRHFNGENRSKALRLSDSTRRDPR
jgi:hypothetical protein